MENVMKKSRKSQFFSYKIYWNYYHLLLCDRIFLARWIRVDNQLYIHLLGVAMFGMGLTIKMDDFKRVFSRPKEIVIGFVAQYTIMPVVAWGLCQLMHLPTILHSALFWSDVVLGEQQVMRSHILPEVMWHSLLE